MNKNIKKSISIIIVAALLMSAVMSAIFVFNYKASAAPSLFDTGQDDLSFDEYNHLETLTLAGDNLVPELTENKTVTEYVITIVKFALGFLGLISVIIVIYGGVMYVSSAGDDDKATTGKNAIKNATIGLLIIMGSYAFVSTVMNAGGGSEGGQTVIGANTGRNFNAVGQEIDGVANNIEEEFTNLFKTNQTLTGILSDAESSALDYDIQNGKVAIENMVNKSSILTFLSTTVNKISNIQDNIPVVSNTYIKLNNLKRKINADITKISGLGKLELKKKKDNDYILFGSNEFKSDSDCKSITNKIGISDELDDDCEIFSYTKDMYKEWALIKDDIKSSDGDRSLEVVFQERKKVFKKALIENIATLVQIQQSLSGISAAQDGSKIKLLFDEIFTHYGNGVNASSTSNKTAFYKEFDSWTLNSEGSSVETMMQELKAALKAQKKLSDEIKKLKSVEAHLTANTTIGKAPLVVTFDATSSVDPSGASIIDKNIDWSNLDGGTISIDNNGVISKKDIGMDSGAVTCENTENSEISKNNKEVFGAAYRQCVFNYPGTYMASIKINSNEPTNFVAGSSSLIIKVEPPTTKINLDMKLNNGTVIPVMGYYDDTGIIKVSKNNVQLTLAEAKEGVTFDASNTKNVTNFKWEMPGDVIEDGGSDFNTYNFSAKKEGKYSVALETVNKIGEVDRKEFTVTVSDAAARIQILPEDKIFIGETLTINGSASSASSGIVQSHEWEITNLSNNNQSLELGEKRNKTNFTYEFKKPGRYRIDLYVTARETVAATPVYVTVVSKPPVAIFDYEFKKENQPGTIYLDASRSNDEDGKLSNIGYEWSISPDSNGGENWVYSEDTSKTDIRPVIKFNKKGKYDITLKTTDITTIGEGIEEESSSTTKSVDVENILDVKWGNNQDSTAILNENSVAKLNFEFESENGKTFKIDFGDDQEEFGDINGTKSISHEYKEKGKYTVQVRIYDTEEYAVELKRQVFISGGDSVIAKAKVLVEGVEQIDPTKKIIVNKGEVITFDASDSKNTDGTGRDLIYSWNFGDTEMSTKKVATHSYSETSPDDIGYFKVKLTVYDENNKTKKSSDEFNIYVVSQPPVMSSLNATPATNTEDLTTPLMVNLKVNGAKDVDGDIIQYRWWYYNQETPDKELGVSFTDSPTNVMQIGTNGKEDEEITYAFGVEITDSDNNKISSENYLRKDEIPTIKVVNGPNEPPIAKMSATQTNIYVGDSVTFTSASSDKDGNIEKYIWDIYGDGFYNDKQTEESSKTVKYEKASKDGYNVRLKVIDNEGGEAVSQPISIKVQSNAKPPVAAFKVEAVDGGNTKNIKFINNSTSDTQNEVKILRYEWDFDAKPQGEGDLEGYDSDGDGNSDNDVDSTEKEPTYTYGMLGTYTVKLTITDSQGAKDTVYQKVQVPVTAGATANFKYAAIGNKIKFKNTSETGAIGGTQGLSYAWDFDTSFDSDKDGDPANDIDSIESEPEYEYTESGTYKVRLKIVDSNNESDIVTRDVVFEKSTIGGSGLIVDTEKPGTENNDTEKTGETDKKDETSTQDEQKDNNENTGTETQKNDPNLVASLVTTPVPQRNGVIYLSGEKQFVLLDFSRSVGNIAYYSIDKNINYDTDGNGITDDDVDFRTSLGGTWQTNFEKAWGDITIRLTIESVDGKTATKDQVVKFN